MTNIMNGDYMLYLENLAIYISQTHTRDYALVLDYMYICFIHINIMCWWNNTNMLYIMSQQAV